MCDFKVLEEQLRAILPAQLVRSDTESLTFYGKDWLMDFTPAPSVIVLPETIEQVQGIVRVCNALRIGLVPSGGRTGLSGGATATKGEVVVSLERMRKILEINRIDRTIRCEAGVVLEQIQKAATEANLYFPVDFSSRGSAQIGGNIATNAGGIRVIRYGNFRESVLGLRVVTGRGDIIELNGSLFKNNSGYDLRNLFIGSEGTLGIIVEATLRLTSPPADVARILVGLEDHHAILPLLTFCRDSFTNLSAFEFMEKLPFEEVIARRGLRNPLVGSYPAYALIECEVASQSDRDHIMESFGLAFENNLIKDVVVSESSAQARELMDLRDLISETLSKHYTLHKNDISVPVPLIPAFVDELRRSIREAYPTFQVAIFGHVGDGNLHVNILKPDDMSDQDFWNACHNSDHAIFNTVRAFHGSISAEHGVGLLKRDFIHYTRSAEEISIMRSIKAAFDPYGIMNPNKLLPKE